ncbi:MAG: radical SAM protein [Nitrospinota bacterium]|nr:radical SAM protein [Nitrospinota bacterium]
MNNQAGHFVQQWRNLRSHAFDIEQNSTAGKTLMLSLWGRPARVYTNANLSIVSGQECNADCPFCVEKLRRTNEDGVFEKPTQAGEAIFLRALDSALDELTPLNPSVSVTGGEPSLDPRLPEILSLLQRRNARKITVTTNGSGLFERRQGATMLDWITGAGARHINISRASVDDARNAALMRMPDGLDSAGLGEVIRLASARGTRPRLSCALMDGEVDNMEGVLEYLQFAKRLGADNVIFRELMKPDPATVSRYNPVAAFCEGARARLAPILRQVSRNDDFRFIRQVMGYYYYVEVWGYGGMDVVFEGADLGLIDFMKRKTPGVIHEFVIRSDGRLGSSWHAREEPLGPPWLAGAMEPAALRGA